MQGDLEAAIAIAQRLEVYRGGDGAKTTTKGPKKVQKSVKGKCGAGRGELIWGDRPSGLGCEETAAKEGQGRLGLRWKEAKEGRTKESPVPQLWWRPLLAGL